MDISLTIARIISFITPWALPLSIVMLLLTALIDIFKKKFHYSKFALIFLVITVILLITQIGLTYQVSKNIINNSSQVPNSDETANWKTYTDNNYNYSIKYPTDWYLVSPGNDGKKSINIQNYLESQVTEQEKQRVSLNPDKISITIGVFDEEIGLNQPLIDWLKANGHYESAMVGVPESVQNIIISGQPALKLDYPGIGVSYRFSDYKHVFYSYFTPGNSSYAKIFDQMLSTFRFD